MNTEIPSPWGLGWTRRLALVNAPDATVQELFTRQLFIGLGMVSVGFLTMSLLATPLVDPKLEMGALMLFVSASPAVACAAVVTTFIVRGRAVEPYAHLITLCIFPIGMGGGLMTQGISVWTNSLWGLTYPLFMFLLTGVRGGLIWTAITAIGWLGIASVDATYGLTKLPAFLPMMDDPYLQASNFITVAIFDSVLLSWFIQQRRIVENLLESERARSDALLRNVLPSAIVDRVRRGEAVADQQEEVTVVFADLVGFTTLASGIPAGRVLEMLAEVFGEIDKIAAEEGVEKVKTIGDCYMAVAGAPVPCRDHPDRALRFACRVRDAINGRTYYGTEIAVRVGVHSGPVVAGIIGKQRLLWDLWGDTVNTASRMESSGIAGEVQVSEATIRLCTGKYDLDDRGVVQLKGRSGLRSFIVRRTELTKAATA
jgi:adenylate cyclase